jgi:hypothetical protein
MSEAAQYPIDPLAKPPAVNQCGTCMYAQNRIVNDNMLHCRRYPPTWTGHAGHAVTVMVAANDWCGEYEPGTPADPSVNLPLNTVPPVIAQNANVVNSTTGTWTGAPTDFSYQWRTGSTNIGGGGPAYIVTVADVGRVVYCVVTATNGGGSVDAPPSNSVTIVTPSA